MMSTGLFWGARLRVMWLAVLAVISLLTSLLVMPVGAARADDSQVTLDKTVSKATVGPGEEFFYELTMSCSGLTTDCIGATLTDNLPAGLDVVSLPADSPEQEVTYVDSSRTLTVEFIIPLSSPPNPEGSTGLPAGATRKIGVSLRVPTETTLEDGKVLTNTAEFGGDNTNTASDSVDITVAVPRVVRPVGTKSWDPSSGVAQSGAESTLTLGVRNASSTSAEVTELSITDVDVETFARFDVTSVGPVVYPPGADQVVIEYCTQPLSACPVGAGPSWTTVEPDPLASVTGLRFTFSDSAGEDLPYSPDQGTVEVGLVLRDTIRSTEQPLAPLERERVENTITPGAVDKVDGAVDGEDVTAGYDINPNIAKVVADKEFCADDDNDFECSGASAIQRIESGVSMNLDATNDSGFPVPAMVIVEPDPNVPAAVEAFAAVDVTAFRVTAPATTGATVVTITCRNGSTPDPVTYFVGTQTVQIQPTFCPIGVFPSSITVTFRGVLGKPTIGDGSLGELDLTGSLNDSAPVGDLENCFLATVSNGVNSGGAGVANACDTTPVVEPVPGGGGDGGTKSSGDVTTIVPGQELEFALQYRNNGNLPLTGVVLVDPIKPAADPSPFDVVRLTGITVVTTSPTSLVEVWDPASGASGAYVPFSTDSALLDRALGLRVAVTGPMAPGQVFTVKYTVLLRDGIWEPGDPPLVFQNCAGVGTDLDDPFCNQSDITAELGKTGGQVNKRFEPSELVRPWPGQDPATIQTSDLKISVANTGTLYLNKIVATDIDQDFFDAYDFRGDVRVNYPPGANRVQLDACVTAPCDTPDDLVLGTLVNDTTPDLPAGVTAADVVGFRVTFTRSDGEYLLTPGQNFSGACPEASICVKVAPRVTLRSDPDTLIPDTVEDTASAEGTSQQQLGGGTFTFGQAPATITVVEGDAAMGITKTPDSRIAPGETAPFYLTVENTGTAPIPELTVVDEFPEGLFLSQTLPGTSPSSPYRVTSVVPSGTSEPPAPVYTPTPDPADPNRVAEAKWVFPGWEFLPGSKVVIEIQVSLEPGAAAGVELTNDARTTSGRDGFVFECSFDGVTQIDGQKWCISDAVVTSLAGTSFDANKWSAGRDDLGFLNTLLDRVYPTGDAACPKLDVDGRIFTRYPCAALNYPGQGFDFVLRLTNASNNAIARTVSLIDTLPVQGDRGIILNKQARETQWSTPPHLLARPREITNYGLGSIEYSTFDTVAEDICFETTGGNIPTGCTEADWSATFPDDRMEISAVRSTLLFTRGLAPGASALVSARVDSPLMLDKPSEAPVAWNSFAHEDFLRIVGAAGRGAVARAADSAISLPPTEPIKAGIAVLYGRVAVAKIVTGTPPSGLGNYTAAYQCTATAEIPGGGQGPAQVVASGTLDLPANQQVEIPELLPAGATCRIWETDANGAQSNADGQANAQTVVVEPILGVNQEPGTAQVVRIVNDYALGSLQLTKALAGVGGPYAAGPFTFAVRCTFEGQTIYDQQVTLSRPTLTATIDKLNVGASCAITELAPYGGADGPAVLSPAGPYIVPPTASGPIKVLATNTFSGGTLTLEKIVTNTEDEVGPFTFQVTCTITGPAGVVDVPLPNSGIVELMAGDQATLEVPIGATCTVEETGVDADVIVTIEDSDATTAGGASDGVVVITAGANSATVAVTNDFSEVGGIEGGGGEGGVSEIAETGASGLVATTGLAAAALLLGAALFGVSLRRRRRGHPG